MSAPQIPNLLAGRGPGGLRGRGKHPLQAASDSAPEALKAQNDKIVQQTDADASISRASAVNAGLLDDAFAHDFAPAAAPSTVHRRFPIINRGTYARTRAIDRLVDDFLESGFAVRKQIVSLGAGSDTRYFRLMSRLCPPDVFYHELDFPENTRAKASVIRKTPAIERLLGDPSTISWTSDEVHATTYHLHAVDLRTLQEPTPTVEMDKMLPAIDPDMPTLILSECCLTYLKPDDADAVVTFLVSTRLSPSSPVGLALYEPINPFDSFGKVMVSNLASRGIVLQTLQKYSSLDAQIARLKSYGLEGGQRAVDVDFLLKCWVDEDEKARVAQAEMLDEVEELKMLLQHYCIAWGWRDSSEAGARNWNRWRTLPNQQAKD